MDTTAVRGDRNGMRGFARLALPACVVVAMAIATFACGGDSVEDAGGSPTQNAPVVTPAVALPSVPRDSAGKAGLLVYRDAAAAQVFALDLSSGGRLPVAGILPTAVASITAFDCTRDGRLIAYSNGAADGRVSVVTFAGEGARSQSVEVRGTIQGMAWSPGGERIAMTLYDESGVHLALLNVSSGQTTTLPTGAGRPGLSRWSPDGQRLVLDINQSGRSDIYVLDVGASNPLKVSTRPSAVTPDWSPDGRTIVFSAGDNQGGFPQIYAVEADGTNERQLTASPSEKWSPRWSLDGSLISYAGLVAVPAVSMSPALLHNQAVWVAGPDGSNESPVTDLALDAQPLAWCLRGSWLQ